MGHRILIAADPSAPSKQSIRYAATVGAKLQHLEFTLLNILPPVSRILMDEAKTDLDVQREIDAAVEHNRKSALAMLESYRSLMGDLGIDTGRVDIQVAASRQGAAKDILEYGQEGRFDAVLIGRRGISRLRTVFMGSVTASILENSKFLPVWVVDGQVTFRSVMMAVDGSESSLRAVDHVRCLLGSSPDIRVTLLHVTPRFTETCPIDAVGESPSLAAIGHRGNKHCIDSFHRKAMVLFEEAGIRNDRIELNRVDRIRSTGKAILEAAEADNHDTIVIGRRGLNRSFFTGSVSRYVMDRATGLALWVVS